MVSFWGNCLTEDNKYMLIGLEDSWGLYDILKIILIYLNLYERFIISKHWVLNIKTKYLPLLY